jgi:hypothetical protein
MKEPKLAVVLTALSARDAKRVNTIRPRTFELWLKQ